MNLIQIVLRVIIGLNGALLTFGGSSLFLVLLAIGPWMNQRHPESDQIFYGLYGLLLFFCGAYQLIVSVRKFNGRSLAIGYSFCLAGFLLAPWAAWVEVGVFITGLVLLGQQRERIE